MATPRKHWWKVADSILRKPWSIEVRSVFLGMGCYLNTRWARDGLGAEDACEALIGPGDLQQITGAGSLARARRMLNAFATHCGCVVNEEGVNTRCVWPNWSEFQGLSAPESPESRPLRKTQDARRKTKEKRPRPPAAPVLPAEALTLARLLIELLRDVPGARIPPRAERQWATYIARMPREIPELGAAPNPWEAIEGAIRWALGPENLGQQYEVVIRSGRALLEKYTPRDELTFDQRTEARALADGP